MALAPISAQGGGPAADAPRHNATKARFVGLRAISCRATDCRTISILAAFEPAGCRRAVEQQELAYARDLLAVGRMPQPEVSNLVQLLRQDVREEPTQEFVPRHVAGP